MIECAGGLLGLPVFLRYGNRIGEGGFWAVFWSFCELAQTGDSDIFYVRQPYDGGNRNEVKI